MMQGALAVLVSALLSATTITSMVATTPLVPLAGTENFQDHCTFSLWQKQVYRLSVKRNYMQINELMDHPNDFVIDLASYRPAASRNSYYRISERHVFAIEGLLDDKNLTFRGKDGSDILTFEYNGLMGWSDAAVGNDDDNDDGAFCHAGPWNTEPWNFDFTSRERKLECAFLCEAITRDEDENYNNEL